MTTTASAARASAAPSYSVEPVQPIVQPPPIAHTSTGHGPEPEGVHTFRNRQSSSPAGTAPCANREIGLSGCGGGGPGRPSDSPVQGSASGAPKRSARA